jgi:ferrochelatase
VIDALLFLGMGGPDSPDAIEPFLKNLLSDRDLIDFRMGGALQNFIASRIAAKRAPQVRPQYELMGGGSPQLAHTMALAKKVASQYMERTGRRLDTFTGMCYWQPFVKNEVDQIRAKNFGRIYIFPMYPQYSSTTTGACYNHLNKAIGAQPFRPPVVMFSRFHTYMPYLEAMALRIRQAAEAQGKSAEEVHVLYSAHSLPQYVVDGGDLYVEELKEQIALLNDLVRPASHSLSFQSKLGRMKWLTPSTLEEIDILHEKGIKNLVVVAISFINDHIETLVELDVDLAHKAKKLGITMTRAASLNDSDDFAEAVTGLLVGNVNG